MRPLLVAQHIHALQVVLRVQQICRALCLVVVPFFAVLPVVVGQLPGGNGGREVVPDGGQ